MDDYLSLHASDPQFMPESNLRFAFTVALVASAYLGDGFSFALYAMASQPEYYARIQAEADALFGDGDPDAQDFNPSNIDVTHRFLMECLRMYPVVPISIRNVMNSCVVGDYVLPVGSRVHIAQTASHFMSDVFPDPFKFDIDRYSASTQRASQPRLRPVRARHPHLSRLPVDGPAAHRQRADGRALLQYRGVPAGLRVPVQPAAVDEAEQEAEVPHRRAEAGVPRLTRLRPTRAYGGNEVMAPVASGRCGDA